MDPWSKGILTRRHFLGCACGAVSASLLRTQSQPLAPTNPKSKKLIEFGWDEPSPAFLRAHAATMQKMPFDGTVFVPSYMTSGGQTGQFSLKVWGQQRFQEKDLQASLENLKAARLDTLRYNFLRFNVTPGDLDWFDDYSAVIENARLAGWFAREGRCPGLMFDPEPYGAPLFDYQKQRYAGTKSWEEYTAQVRLRGRQVMEAFQRAYPGLTVYFTIGYSWPWAEMHRRRLPLREIRYALLPSLLDGMLDAASGKSRFIDGDEAAYYYRKPSDFPKAYRMMKQELLPIVADPAKYAKYFSFSFGIWMDLNSHKLGWSVKNFATNGHTPKEFQGLVTKALEVADEYVWIYTEQPRWWSAPDGKPVRLPTAYETALRRARAAAQ